MQQPVQSVAHLFRQNPKLLTSPVPRAINLDPGTKEAGTTITLEELINTTLQHNYSLVINAHRIEGEPGVNHNLTDADGKKLSGENTLTFRMDYYMQWRIQGELLACAPPMWPNSFVFTCVFTAKHPHRRLAGRRPPPTGNPWSAADMNQGFWK